MQCGWRTAVVVEVEIVAGEPGDRSELMGAEAEGFDAVVKDFQITVRGADVTDEGEEAPRRLAAAVGEEEDAVRGDAAPGLADGRAPKDGFRRQAEQNLGVDLFREVGERDSPSLRRSYRLPIIAKREWKLQSTHQCFVLPPQSYVLALKTPTEMKSGKSIVCPDFDVSSIIYIYFWRRMIKSFRFNFLIYL